VPAAVLIAVVGLALVVTGVLRATVLAPEKTTTGWTAPAPGSVLVDTAPGVLDTDGPSVRVEVRAAQDGSGCSSASRGRTTSGRSSSRPRGRR
jgi:hypothetical protein